MAAGKNHMLITLIYSCTSRTFIFTLMRTNDNKVGIAWLGVPFEKGYKILKCSVLPFQGN